MTYCLGVLLPAGLVLASDSRTNAGIDHIATVRKLALFENPGKAVITVLSAGNLATTQAVVTIIKQNLDTADVARDLFTMGSMFEVAQTVGTVLREVLARDGEAVRPFGDPGASFLIGGQIQGEPPRLFQIYTAGNFIEAAARNPFLQIGETKYGKPILDRAIRDELSLGAAAKLALLSFDATIRSNLSVGPPIDMLCYEADSFSIKNLSKYTEDDPYLAELRKTYGAGLLDVVSRLPEPPLANRDGPMRD
ncbi:putative proteasome-type protease [alpha proteobacterium BAL199]|jgi:putative proteasome-type protease|nr:putative proteasome-type protease [alpha proteobacterium BAL199]